MFGIDRSTESIKTTLLKISLAISNIVFYKNDQKSQKLNEVGGGGGVGRGV